MTTQHETRTITRPGEITRCNKCGAEAIDGVDSTTGWLCIHEMIGESDRNNNPLAVLAAVLHTPNQHVCQKCRPLVADALNTAPVPAPLPPDVLLLRDALERIAQGMAVSQTGAPTLMPNDVHFIASEALAGRVAAATTPAGPPSIQSVIVNALKNGNFKVVSRAEFAQQMKDGTLQPMAVEIVEPSGPAPSAESDSGEFTPEKSAAPPSAVEGAES